MRLHFVWIGKTKDRRCAALIADYLERIGHFAGSEVTELKDQTSGGDERRVIAAEGSRIVGALERDDFVLLLDEGGTQMTSKELAGLIEARRLAGCQEVGRSGWRFCRG